MDTKDDADVIVQIRQRGNVWTLEATKTSTGLQNIGGPYAGPPTINDAKSFGRNAFYPATSLVWVESEFKGHHPTYEPQEA